MKAIIVAGLLATAAAFAWFAWLNRPADDPPLDAPASAPEVPDPTPAPEPPPQAAPPPAPPPAPSPPSLDPRPLAAVERHCPWPPDPMSWRVLGAPCLEAMDAIMMNEDWRLVLDDPLGTRRAVAEAFDWPDCRVPPPVDADGNLSWPGEVRADLREPCAAGAMVRLAKLQAMCIVNVHRDWEVAFEIDEHVRLNWFSRRPADNMMLYHREVKDRNHGSARVFWEVYRCRSVPPEALEWIDALPAPPSDLSAIEPIMVNTNPATVTQLMHLEEAARRLGWEFPPAREDVLRDFAARQLEPDLPPFAYEATGPRR